MIRPSEHPVQRGIDALDTMCWLLDSWMEFRFDHPDGIFPEDYVYSWQDGQNDFWVEPHVLQRFQADVEQIRGYLGQSANEERSRLSEDHSPEISESVAAERVKQDEYYIRAVERAKFHRFILRYPWIFAIRWRCAIRQEYISQEEELNQVIGYSRFIPLDEVRSRVSDAMIGLQDAVLAAFREELPWGTSENLMPQGDSIEAEHSVYLTIRRQIREYRSRKKLANCELRSWPRQVEIPDQLSVDNACSDGEQDGPIDALRFRWKGEVYDMPKLPWKLVLYMWNRESVPIDDLAEDLWAGEETQTDDRRKIQAAISRLHRWFMDREITIGLRLNIAGEFIRKKYEQKSPS